VRIVADENIPALESLWGGECEVITLPGREIRRHHLLRADALLVRSVTTVDAGLLSGSAVRFVGSATAGTEHVDKAWLDQAGIAFANAPGANANSVVEYVLCAIAAVDDYLEQLLAGARVGIVGGGHVGSALASRLAALGIDTLVCDPWLDQRALPHAAVLDDVLRCEVVCLHPELTDRQPWPSFHLLDRQRLAQLKAHQLIVNASRGAVIDNAALLNRLFEPDAPAVVLDVWEQEPAVNADLLARVRLGSAHIAGYSLDGKVLATRMLRVAMEERFATLSRSQGVDPLPEREPLRLDHAAGPADVLRQLLAASYGIEEDDQLLRAATFGLEPGAAADNFDRLRKHYAQRRELAGRRVVLARHLDSWRPLVSAIACVPSNVESDNAD